MKVNLIDLTESPGGESLRVWADRSKHEGMRA